MNETTRQVLTRDRDYAESSVLTLEREIATLETSLQQARERLYWQRRRRDDLNDALSESSEP